ncbi:hypothetical protein PR202_gb23819 [Eleusine coracana subsp. coracana]|uniref:Uncharacterized protein n=1 Tax=Eleusine coracana subsp. coracana TaxID=191504 RepID=A0AAV5FLD6_ELECO|nr:hypothetical protein PR202_gb23819 [Eleusine coracana subsp. coracana]
MVMQREEVFTGHPDEMVLDATWPDIGDDVGMVGKQIARMLHGDLLEEIIVEFFS